jgi:Mg2+ and Co2+ transporter CorA
MGTDVERVPIKATFISVPIFALMQKSNENLPYLNRHALRTPARHPIRSLLQYSNILALDTERDKRQVIVVNRLGEDDLADSKPFIHVPEMWALVINMYTVITVAPFSSQALLGENIQLVQPPTNRQRFIVKFTSLRGTLHDLRCQTWFGLLDAISRIEWSLKDIDVLLNDSSTEYKLIDQKFHTIDQDRWTKLAEAKGVRRIGVRLVRIPAETALTLDFASRKLRACVNATWVLLGLPYQEDILEAKLDNALERSAPSHEVEKMKLRLDGLAETERRFKRSRYFNRMLLYAARSNILNPKATSSTSRKAKTRRAFGRVVMASKLGPAAQPEVSSLSSIREDQTSNIRPVLYENRLKIPGIAIRKASDASTASKISILVPQNTDRKQSIPEAPDPADGAAQRNNLSNGEPASWYETGKDAQILDGRSQYAKLYSTRQAESRPTSSAKPRASIWAPMPDHTNMDRIPMSTQGGIIPAIVDPYSSEHSTVARKDYTAVEALSHGATQQLPKPRSATGRRHSSFGVAGEVLAASPLRLPLRLDDHTVSSRQPASSLTPPEARTPQLEQVTFSERMSRGQFRTNLSIDEDYFPVTVAEKVVKRAKETVDGRTPFFQWRTNSNPAALGRIEPVGSSVNSKTDRVDMTIIDSKRGPEVQLSHHSHAAHDILTDIDNFIIHGKYHDKPKFDVSPSDYDAVVSRKRSEVISHLDSEAAESARPSMDIGPEEDEPVAARRQFSDSKIQLLLGVHSFLECFVNQDEVDAKVLGKVWGLMYNLCQLQLVQVSVQQLLNFRSLPGRFCHARLTSQVASSNERKIKLVQSAVREVEIMEMKCKHLLHMNHQLDVANDHAARANFHVPPPLLAAFKDFVLFLLSTDLAVWEDRVSEGSINIIKDKVHQGLHQSQSMFLRMNEHLEMDLDQIGYESIRTADSILGLLFENALNISCQESGEIAGDDTEMDFDIVEIYSRYTANAIDRAKQEASARVYEDIRLLREEIDTISLVLKHQSNLVQRILDTRESALQNLDKRYIYRVNTNLDEMIRHFSTLSDYAIQAEFWARNSIEIRSENNNKAIYVFTAVTVIFLPLSFVTGLLGMNTFDIRNLTHGQWLFWATALPFTLAVLIICLCIVNYKFKLKKRVRRFLIRSRVARSFRRTTKSVKSSVRNAYFHQGHAGYGLRFLLPFGLYQRWRIRKTKRKMHLKQYEND